jgi:TetR/AcrR family transcriptional regulator, transcriptional repressor for nem operon
MGHSQAEKVKSRQRILDAAALQIRDLGLEGVSIGDLMRSAKLTHGGFYGHFGSRDDLIAEALEKALNDGEAEAIRSGSAKGPHTLKSMLNSYLSKAHRDNRRSGCAVAALAGDAARGARPPREIMTNHLSKYFDDIAQLVGGDNAEDFAISIVCTIVGAVVLSRVVSNQQVSDSILAASRRTLLEYAARRGPPKT